MIAVELWWNPAGVSEAMENAVAWSGCRSWGSFRTSRAMRRFEISSGQDRRADAGEWFFGRRAQQGLHAERKAMIDRFQALPITKQAKALNISRGSV
jgi:hypothetical protein